MSGPDLDELAARVEAAAPRLGRTRLVCVDGPAGSGKTTWAGRLAAALGDVRVIHLDDLYEGWSGLPGVWDRLWSWVLEPLGRGEAGRYRRYDWDREEWAEWHEVPAGSVLVVEGVGAAQRAVDPIAVLRVWVEAPPAERLRRGLDRDGEAMRAKWLAWQADEEAHFAAERTRERADVRVDGTAGSA